MIPTDQSASGDATTLTVLSDSTDVHAAEGPSTEDFLRALAPETAPRITVQTFKEAPEAKRPDLIQIIHFDASEYEEHLPRLQELNRAGAGIFVTVNETNGAGRKAKDVQTCRAQMLDLDGAPLPTNWAIEPSIVVESSPAKYHVYWLLRDGDIARFTDIQEKLAGQYGGDPAVKDVARVMRLPGTFHLKTGEPSRTRILEFHPERRYTQDELAPLLTSTKPPESVDTGELKMHSWRSNHAHQQIRTAYNRLMSPVALLESYGYKAQGNRLIAPDSTSGHPGITLLPAQADQPQRVYSHHTPESDPLADDHAHDAFSILVKLGHKDSYMAALNAAAEATDLKALLEDESHKNKKASEKAVEYVRRLDPYMFLDQKGNARVSIVEDGKRRTYKAQSEQFYAVIEMQYYLNEHKPCPGGAVREAASLFKTMALHKAESHDVYVRIANVASAVYIDLNNSALEIIEVTKDGLQIVPSAECSIFFDRPRGAKALPIPVAGGDLHLLRPFINSGDEAFLLVVAYLIQSLTGRAPFPLLALNGEQGTGKTFLSSMIRKLLDPHEAALRSAPKDERDLFIAAERSFLYDADNLSKLTEGLSDALCRLCTGAAFTTREVCD